MRNTGCLQSNWEWWRGWTGKEGFLRRRYAGLSCDGLQWSARWRGWYKIFWAEVETGAKALADIAQLAQCGWDEAGDWVGGRQSLGTWDSIHGNIVRFYIERYDWPDIFAKLQAVRAASEGALPDGHEWTGLAFFSVQASDPTPWPPHPHPTGRQPCHELSTMSPTWDLILCLLLGEQEKSREIPLFYKSCHHIKCLIVHLRFMERG
jgi:hypothetical protein